MSLYSCAAGRVEGVAHGIAIGLKVANCYELAPVVVIGGDKIQSCSRILGSSHTLIASLWNGDGSGSLDVKDRRMPSVVSRVRRYGEVKICSVSSFRKSARSRRPASCACVHPSGVSFTL